MLTALFILLLLIVVYLVLLLPRRRVDGWEKLRGARYAHRGLHDKTQGIPENSMAAFRRAIDHGFGAELDVHLLADGNLAVFHDATLKRICGAEGTIEALTAADLKKYHLLGTEETIPLFRDVLDLFEGKQPLIIELKAVDGNAVALTDAVMAMLKDYRGDYCIESFQPGVIRRMKTTYPSVIRGQLSENFFRAKTLPFVPTFLMTFLLTTFYTRPDFIAYCCKDRKNISLRLMRRLYGVQEVGWTIREQSVMEELERDNVIPIFENFIP